MPFVQLQALLAVAQTKNFSSAARELGISRSAMSQSIRQLEEQLHVVLVHRTTRSVALTDVGRRLVDEVAPAFAQTAAALTAVSAKPGEAVGRLRLSVPHAAIPLIIEPVLPEFRARHPRVEVEIIAEDRFVDIVASGFDAGVRLSESIERDMVQVRLTDPLRFVIVGAPEYFAKRGRPQRPQELLDHECITSRRTNGSLYAWEFERGRKNWKMPVRGGVVVNEGLLCVTMARLGLGLAYALEPFVREELRSGELEMVLEAYAATVPGFFLYYPSRSQRSLPLELFADTAKQILRYERSEAKRVRG
ncbi:MAG TPA: LysR family transcriptional regulator [Polyangiaceae bacterium]|nr:LysR family transcriptional regulator [Polyangiaceae bacterium]